MTIKPIPYGRQNISEEDIKSVVSVLKADYLTQGPKVKEFEEAFADYLDAKYAVAVSNATAGLHLGVLALGLEKGDRIITTPITFAASANCARYVGAEVWFADIDPETYLMCLDKTEELLKSKPRGFFKGIIPVDFAGLPINTEAFKSLADKYGLWIIEDACHAPGGYYLDSSGEKQMCGNAKYTDLGIFSFHPVKHIACGEGGMITTNNEKLYKSLLKLRTHGITKEKMSENHGGWYYEMQELGYNYRLTDIQSALGISQLKKNKKGVIIRNQIAERYKRAFQGVLKYQSLPANSFNAHHLFVVEVEDRLGLYNYLLGHNIFAQIHYIPAHMLPYYKKIGYDDADLSNAEKYYEKCISLPMYPTLTKDEQQYVIEKVLSFYGE